MFAWAVDGMHSMKDIPPNNEDSGGKAECKIVLCPVCPIIIMCLVFEN